MKRFFLLPQRCLHCGQASERLLCLACSARFQPLASPNAGWGHCPLCGQVLLAEKDRCVDCAVQPWSFPCLEGLLGYQEPGGELVRQYKFGGWAELARSWAERAAPRLWPPGPLVPVPPLRRNLWRRGWDPVDTLTRALGRSANLPIWRVLIRHRSADQKTLDRRQRVGNAAAAYGLKATASRLSRLPRVWLVDDVVTTGATAEACTRLLRQAGVQEVRVLCLGLH